MRVTGQLHVGHYWGTLRNWIQLQNEYQCYFGVMDWHGMTTAYKTPGEIPAWSLEMVADWIAWGIDPEKCTLFVQSSIPEHIELFMFLANLTPIGWLERVNTWKDSIEEMKANDTYNLGRFAYPVLQTADILAYQAHLVPIGQDQVAHLEISREIVRRVNFLYKTKFPEPQPLLTDTPLVPGLDGRKMSKSYNNTLFLVEEEKTLRKKINSMVTDPQRVKREDPGNPEVCPVFLNFHKLYSTEQDKSWIQEGCRTAGIGCGDCKLRLFENINKDMSIAREKKKELLAKPEILKGYIQEGCLKAQQEAQLTLKILKKQMKLL